jgi:uncharacterized membrane protein YheB (UPF0754 family)
LDSTFQGLIPRRQEDLAHQTAEIIESEILHQHAIRNAIRSVDIEPHLKSLVERMVDRKLREKLAAIPFVGSFINDATLDMIKKMAVDSLKEEIPGIIDHVANDLESKIQVRHMVQARINALDLDALERIVLKVARNEFRTIEYLGRCAGLRSGPVAGAHTPAFLRELVFFFDIPALLETGLFSKHQDKT